VLELPVACGSSSLKPEVASSGFSFFVLLSEIAKLLHKNKIFFNLQKTQRSLGGLACRHLQRKTKRLQIYGLNKK